MTWLVVKSPKVNQICLYNTQMMTNLFLVYIQIFLVERSLFQVNLWIPFVNVEKTKSMFIIKPDNSLKILKKIKSSKK